MIDYEEHILSCLEKAERGESKLNDSDESPLITNNKINGLIGIKTQHFYNNLLSIDNTRYLEIGCWQGCSTFSAAYKNNCNISVIDNWSEFGGKKEFQNNLELYRGNNTIDVYDEDSFLMDVTKLPKFNIYMYDGDHSIVSQYSALTYYIHNLDDYFIYVVDDWNWRDVRTGTFLAIQDLKLKTLFSKEIRLTDDNTHTPHDIAYNDWWNGIGIFVLSKV